MSGTKSGLHLVANSKECIANILCKEGYNLKDLFLKYNNPIYSISNNSNTARSLNGTETTETSTVLERELNILRSMREFIPDNVPRIIADVQSETGILCGYVIDYVPGEYFFSGSYSENNDSLSQLERIIKKLHENNMAHGDLHKKNIIVNPAGKVMLIDPYAFSEEDPITVFKLHAKIDDMHLYSYEEDIQLQFISAQRK